MRTTNLMNKLILRSGYILALLATAPLKSSQAAGKSWPNIRNILVTASYTYVGTETALCYDIANSTENVLSLSRFEVDHRLDPGEHPLSAADLTATHSLDQHMEILKRARKISPIHVSSPVGWESKYPGMWWAEGLDPHFTIQPGRVLTGLCLSYFGGVGIRDYVVDADDADFINHREEYEFSGTTEQLITEVSKGVTAEGKTIAFVEPATPFDFSSSVQQLERLADEAHRLGWIRSKEELEKIRGMLKALKGASYDGLEHKKDALFTFLAKEKTTGRLSSEADALIRLNVQYILRSEENKK